MSAIFFVHGAVFASWAARVPAVQDELHLSEGVLGLVLAGPGLGALAGSQVGGTVVHRFGSRTVSALAPVTLSVPLALVPASASAWTLTAVLVMLGAADGCTSVAMNAQAVVVQRRYGRTVVNSMHATRSIGAVAGGLAGSATAAAGLTLTTQFVLVAAALGVVSAVAACGLGPSGAEARPESGRRGQPPARTGAPTAATARTGSKGGKGGRRSGGRESGNGRLLVLLLASMTFLAALVSDTPASWSGVYLRHVGADAATAAAGYAAFSAGEVVTRLFNDRLVNRLGWARLIRGGTLCCTAALTTALLLGHPGLALAALVVAGAGISAVFPGVFTAAGALPRPALAMGRIGVAGNLGWLLVGPVIGGLATLVGLSAAFGVMAVSAAVVAVLAPVTRSATAGERSTPGAGSR